MRYIFLLIGLLISISANGAAYHSNVELFPIAQYNQNVDDWLNPHDADYESNLLSLPYQSAKLSQLKHIYYGTGTNDHSPWSREYIVSLLAQKPNIAQVETGIVNELATNNISSEANSINTKINYGVNFRPYDKAWFTHVKSNMQLVTLQSVSYSANMRAIATDNVYLRKLPTDTPLFNDPSIPGEGYPFDNLQQTAVFAGTPLYVIATTQDRQWSLVVAPDYIGWIKSNVIGMVDDKFIATWQAHAYANLVGITTTDVAIINQYGQYQFSGYVGMLFPLAESSSTYRVCASNCHSFVGGDPCSKTLQIMIPLRDSHGMAQIGFATLASEDTAILPLAASRATFAKIIHQLQGRPYGWGNIHFYNDCSSELKAIYALMGIYLPRNTTNQKFAGKMVDISNLNTKARLDYLLRHGVPFLTLAYTKGHILMYVGNYTDKDGKQFALSYQEMWGLRPKDESYRSVVGQAVFFPLYVKYGSKNELKSQASFSTFKLIYLNESEGQITLPKFGIRALTY